MRKSMSGSLMKPLSFMCLAFALLHGFVASGLVAMMSGSRPWPKDACCWAMVIGVAVVSALLVHLIAMFACCAYVAACQLYSGLACTVGSTQASPAVLPPASHALQLRGLPAAVSGAVTLGAPGVLPP